MDFLALFVLAVAALMHATDARQLSWWRTFHKTYNDTTTTTTHTATYRSKPLALTPGMVVNTEMEDTFMEFPSGTYAITSFTAEIVNKKGESIPLIDAYLHHWIIENNDGNAGPCDNLRYVLGVGSESRNTVMELPDGYGLHVKDNDRWRANIHLIDTRKPVWDVKSCIECACEFGGGSIDCCPDGSICPLDAIGNYESSSLLPKNYPKMQKLEATYFLEYTLTYVTGPAAAMPRPVSVHVLDNTHCGIEYNVPPACAWWIDKLTQSGRKMPSDYRTAPGCALHSLAASYPVLEDSEILFAVGHQHIGAVNISLAVDRRVASQEKGTARSIHGAPGITISDVETICTSTPIYGAGEDAGDELGYITAMSTCVFGERSEHVTHRDGAVVANGRKTGVVVKKGDMLTVNSLYEQGPGYRGVMGYFYIMTSRL